MQRGALCLTDGLAHVCWVLEGELEHLGLLTSMIKQWVGMICYSPAWTLALVAALIRGWRRQC